MFAALVLTEVMAEARDNNSTLHIAFMDTSKAFDVVDHHSMLNALHQQGVNGKMWGLFDSLYDGITSIVQWKGQLSNPFTEHQGIRQGGGTSADLYKSGKNSVLSILDSNTSNQIGHINTGAIMVADDLAITATNSLDLQHGISIAELDSSRQRYSFNTEKTKIISCNTSQTTTCVLNGKEIGNSIKEVHLGISRNSENNHQDTVNDRIKSARRRCTASWALASMALMELVLRLPCCNMKHMSSQP